MHASSLGSGLLIAGGVLSAAVALLHAVIVWYGAPAYRYFGAGERLARMAEHRSPWPAIVTLGIAATLLLFAAYAFAGAGLLSLPRAGAAVLSIGAIYTTRGVALAPVAIVRRRASRFDIVSSLVSLGMGILHLAGFGILTGAVS